MRSLVLAAFLALVAFASGCTLPLASGTNVATTFTPFNICFRVNTPTGAGTIEWAAMKTSGTVNYYTIGTDNYPTAVAFNYGHVYRIQTTDGTSSDYSGNGKVSLLVGSAVSAVNPATCATLGSGNCVLPTGYTDAEVTWSASGVTNSIAFLDGAQTSFTLQPRTSITMTGKVLFAVTTAAGRMPILDYQTGIIVVKYTKTSSAITAVFSIGDGAADYSAGSLYFEVGQFYTFVPDTSLTDYNASSCGTVDGSIYVFAIGASGATTSSVAAVTGATVWGATGTGVLASTKVGCMTAANKPLSILMKPTTTGTTIAYFLGGKDTSPASQKIAGALGTTTQCTPSATTICVMHGVDFTNTLLANTATAASNAIYNWYLSQGATQWTSATTDANFGAYQVGAKITLTNTIAATFQIVPVGYGSAASSSKTFFGLSGVYSASTNTETGTINTASSFTQCTSSSSNTAAFTLVRAAVGDATTTALGKLVCTFVKKSQSAAWYVVPKDTTSAGTVAATLQAGQIDVYPILSGLAVKSGSTTLTLTPTFATTTYAYNVSLTNTQSAITITPTESLDAAITTKSLASAYKGTALTASSGTYTSNVDTGATVATASVTANTANTGTTTQLTATYTLNVKRATGASNYALITICTTAIGATTYCHDTGSGPKSSFEASSRFGASALTLTSGVAVTFEATGTGDFATNPYILTTSATGGCTTSCVLVTGTTALSAAGQTTGFTPALTTVVYYQNSAKAGWGSGITVVSAGSTGSVTNPCISAPWLCASSSSVLVSLFAVVAPIIALFML